METSQRPVSVKLWTLLGRPRNTPSHPTEPTGLYSSLDATFIQLVASPASAPERDAYLLGKVIAELLPEVSIVAGTVAEPNQAISFSLDWDFSFCTTCIVYDCDFSWGLSDIWAFNSYSEWRKSALRHTGNSLSLYYQLLELLVAELQECIVSALLEQFSNVTLELSADATPKTEVLVADGKAELSSEYLWLIVQCCLSYLVVIRRTVPLELGTENSVAAPQAEPQFESEKEFQPTFSDMPSLKRLIDHIPATLQKYRRARLFRAKNSHILGSAVLTRFFDTTNVIGSGLSILSEPQIQFSAQSSRSRELFRQLPSKSQNLGPSDTFGLENIHNHHFGSSNVSTITISGFSALYYPARAASTLSESLGALGTALKLTQISFGCRHIYATVWDAAYDRFVARENAEAALGSHWPLRWTQILDRVVLFRTNAEPQHYSTHSRIWADGTEPKTG